MAPATHVDPQLLGDAVGLGSILLRGFALGDALGLLQGRWG